MLSANLICVAQELNAKGSYWLFSHIRRPPLLGKMFIFYDFRIKIFIGFSLVHSYANMGYQMLKGYFIRCS